MYQPHPGAILSTDGAAQMHAKTASEHQASQPRLATAFEDLGRAINVLADVASGVAERTQCLQRPAQPEPASPTTGGGQPIRAASNVVNTVEEAASRVRHITSGLQSVLQRLEV